jgi:hypothetical protein
MEGCQEGTISAIYVLVMLDYILDLLFKSIILKKKVSISKKHSRH